MHDEGDSLYIHQNEDESHTYNIGQIQSIVSLADTHSQPRTMMIDLLNADITVMAMRSPRWPIDEALIAKA